MHSLFVLLLSAGGPGSNKSQLASNSSPYFHLSIGAELRSLATKGHPKFTDDQVKHIRHMMAAGDLVSNDIIMNIINQVIAVHRRVVIDGFPRNSLQLKAFQELV